MGLFLDSPGHRQSMLDPNHRKVGIGISYRPPTIWFVQLFVGDYIEYRTKPTIESGNLNLSGKTKNGATFYDATPTVMLYYDHPPEPLTRGQLSRTYCYSYGLPIARIQPPLEPGSRYTRDEVTLDVESKSCPDPYDIAPDDTSPASSEEAHSNWEQARKLSQAEARGQFTFSLITADTWSTQGDTFTMAADMSTNCWKPTAKASTPLRYGAKSTKNPHQSPSTRSSRLHHRSRRPSPTCATSTRNS